MFNIYVLRIIIVEQLMMFPVWVSNCQQEEYDFFGFMMHFMSNTVSYAYGFFFLIHGYLSCSAIFVF